MISVDGLLGIICTKSFEVISENSGHYRNQEDNSQLSPVDYQLELIRNSNGTLEWYE